MNRLLKIVVCVCWSTLAVAQAEAALVIRTGPVARPAFMPRIYAPHAGPAVRGRFGAGGFGTGRVATGRVAAGRLGRRIERGAYGYGALGLAGFGLDSLGVGAAALPPGPFGEPGLLPPPILLPPPPPPACPLVIEVGRGLQHKVQTRIVSGHPICR